MKKSIQIISAIIIMMFAASNASFAQMKMAKPQPNHPHHNAAALKTEMRKLWEDHATWTRNVILCLVDDLPGKDQAVKRLLQNQEDIGNAFKPFYGEEAGNKLTVLLKEHINIAVEVVNETKAGNVLALDGANKRWYANADKISELLNKQNSYWPLADLITMMNEHLKLTNDEAVQRIKKNYDADIVAYDKLRAEILMMSDMLADGIIKQFPARFKAMKKPKKSSQTKTNK